MIKLELDSLSTESKKEAKRVFDILVALITPQVREVTKKGVTTSKVSSGSLSLYEEAVKGLNIQNGGTVTISKSKTGLFIYNSTSVAVEDRMKKKLTKSNLLRLSGENINRIYTDNGLDMSEAWYFTLEEVLIDLPWEENAKVFMFKPFEKRA